MGILNFWKHYGILGINARNLHYLPLNDREAKRMADDKLKTKSFLSAREINVPRLLGRISSHSELENFNWDSLADEFVLKPNNGYGGEGILVLEKDGRDFKTIGKEKPITLDNLKIHINDILDGKFSLGGFHDEAFFEQRLVLHHDLVPLVPGGGLPDVRIIYYNLVPVMAMLRLPTKTSGGKANVHVGGVGVGIDLATGKTTYATQYNKFIEEIPDVGPSSGYIVPHFDAMLLMGSKIQQSVSLGYLAVDFVPDENTGPTLLEINARAGLMAQVANHAPLRRRLNRVKGTKVGSPEKGVQIGKDLFSEKKVHHIKKENDEAKEIVGTMEEVTLILPYGREKVIARIKPDSDKTYLDSKILEKIKQGYEEAGEDIDNFVIKYVLGSKRHRTVPTPRRLRGEYEMIIGAKNLTGVLIDPNKKPENKKTVPKPEAIKEEKSEVSTFEKLLEIDKSLSEIDEKIKTLYYFRPRNLDEEKRKFFADKKYNPQFIYPSLKFDATDFINKINSVVISPNLPGASIFIKKQKELINKINLISSRGTDEFTKKSQEFYADIDSEILSLASSDIKKFEINETEKDNSEKISSLELVAEFKNLLKEQSLFHWDAKESNIVADCIVQQRAKKIVVRAGAEFSMNRVRKLILHEFYTHVLRTANGENQPFKIFRFGLSHYLEIEEGLAIYNQINYLNPPQEDQIIRSAFIYTAVNIAMQNSFREVFKEMKKKGADDEYAFQLALKAKRGMTDTSQKGAFTKDLIYYQGYQKIKDFIKNGGDLKRLYIGKVSLDNLEEAEKLPRIIPPKYIPPFLS